MVPSARDGDGVFCEGVMTGAFQVCGYGIRQIEMKG